MDPDAVGRLGRVPHGSDPDVELDFSANCNPRVPDGARAAYEAAFASSRRYPRDDYPDFRRAAADYVGCDPAHVVPTAGGTEALRLAVATTVGPGESALVPAPSFGEYAREIRLQGATPTFVPAADLLDEDPTGHALAVVCTPNNPTGTLPSRDDLLDFAARCRDADCLLLADEAFLDFTDQRSLAGTPGVVVARSLTKMFGLPGLRCGFAVATDAAGGTRDRIRTAVPPWTLGTPAAAVGTHCLRDDAFVAATRERVRRERAFLCDGLDRWFDVGDSDAPFLLCDVGDDPAPLVSALRDDGVAVRDATTFRGLETHVRVAVRERADNEQLLNAVATVVDQGYAPGGRTPGGREEDGTDGV